jgi:CRISPR-associated protein Cmr2
MLEDIGVEVMVPSSENSFILSALATKKPPTQHIGSLPDILEARVPVDESRNIARQAVELWNGEWAQIEKAVWEYLKAKSNGLLTSDTETIWQRQISHFWYSRWVIGNRGELKRRNFLRNFEVPDEPGEKCTVCGEREVLRGDETTRRGVRQFWTALSARLAPMDIRGNGSERLCSVCTVKRLFPRVAEEAIGWSVPTAYPSTATMASLMWRASLFDKSRNNNTLCQAMASFVTTLNKHLPKENYQIRAANSFAKLQKVAAGHPLGSISDDLLQCDGDFFFPDALESSLTDNFRLNDSAAAEIIASQSSLLKAARKAGVGSPSPFYALLVMDGDQMGKIFETHQDKSQDISSALGRFSKEVAEITESADSCGRVVYAGGDDVLVLLPMETALPTVKKLREAYIGAFREKYSLNAAGIRPTISAVIVYAHMQAPLQAVVRRGHELLDHVVKEQTGRNAFGIEVWKRGGPALCFARAWQSSDAGVTIDWVEEIENLRKALEDRRYSSSFLHRLKERCDILSPPDDERIMEDRDFIDLMVAEYRRRREASLSDEDARSTVEKLLAVSLQHGRRPDGTPWTRFEGDPGLFLSFLGQKEV